MYSCPECDQPINQASEVCPYCGADLTATSPETEGAPPRKRSVTKIVVLWSVVLLSLVLISWLALPWHLGGTKSEAEAHALAAITELQQALASYQASERAFPSSLEPLGTAARDASQKAESGRYTLQYTPGKPDSDGRITSYTLTARAGNYGYVNLFVEESGLIHATRENRPASAQDPVVEPNPQKNR